MFSTVDIWHFTNLKEHLTISAWKTIQVSFTHKIEWWPECSFHRDDNQFEQQGSYFLMRQWILITCVCHFKKYLLPSSCTHQKILNWWRVVKCELSRLNERQSFLLNNFWIKSWPVPFLLLLSTPYCTMSQRKRTSEALHQFSKHRRPEIGG